MYYWSVSYQNWLWHFDRWEEAAPARQITCCARPNTKTEVTFTWLMFRWKSMLNAEKTYEVTIQDTSSFDKWVEMCSFLTCEFTQLFELVVKVTLACSFLREIVYYAGLHFGIENDGTVGEQYIGAIGKPWWEIWMGEWKLRQASLIWMLTCQL